MLCWDGLVGMDKKHEVAGGLLSRTIPFVGTKMRQSFMTKQDDRIGFYVINFNVAELSCEQGYTKLHSRHVDTAYRIDSLLTMNGCGWGEVVGTLAIGSGAQVYVDDMDTHSEFVPLFASHEDFKGRRMHLRLLTLSQK